MVCKPSFQSGVFGDSSGHAGCVTSCYDILRDMKVTPESAEMRQRGSKVYSQELLEIITVLLIINE